MHELAPGYIQHLVGWTQSFIVDRRVELIINGYINPEIMINIDIS